MKKGGAMMKKVNVMCIEPYDSKKVDFVEYTKFITFIFKSLGYEAVIKPYPDESLTSHKNSNGSVSRGTVKAKDDYLQTHQDKIDKFIFSKNIEAIFCDLTFGKETGDTLLGFKLVRYLKHKYPEIVTCGFSGLPVLCQKMDDSHNILPFDLFIDKAKCTQEDYKNYVVNKMKHVFCLNVGIDIITDNLSDADKKFVNNPFFIRLLKKITFTAHGNSAGTSVKKITLYPTKGGRASHVFKMLCETESGDDVISSVLKCAEKTFIEQEINNYMAYVKWYLPYTWRPELLSYAFGEDYGMICYSSVYNDAVSFSSLADKISDGDFLTVNNVLEKIFANSCKQWYGQNNRGIIDKSINQYYNEQYFSTKKAPADLVDASVRAIGGYIYHGEYVINGKTFPLTDNLFTRFVSNNYQECLCHGDLNADNIQISKHGEIMFIDFQDSGKRPVFHDFAVLELSLRLYQSSEEHVEFNTLLDNEIKISNNTFPATTELTMWTCIQKMRTLAMDNFNEETFDAYYLSIAMLAFKLFRVYGADVTKWETKVLLAVLLANLLKLKK
ncbi:MAG: aminoglycoside phosphotransferase family protein [Nitrososphaerota archaeon]|jgi:hypothetical protein|nr:aminoglycoside phosphotransferase family protein [Nitrososphaerota archaeon]